MPVKAVRGAIGVEENTQVAIYSASSQLISVICRRNSIAEKDIISIVFSVTKDLNLANPATGLRQTGYNSVPLFCVQEAYIEGSRERMLRVLLMFNTVRDTEAEPVYLNGADGLRPDLHPE